MQIVIDIPDKVYEMVMNTGTYGCYHFISTKAIREGVPLPEEHGRVIDADVLVDGMEDNYEFCEAVNATPTIIPAAERKRDGNRD